MSYLLDTNACIAAVGGKPPLVRERFEAQVRAGARIAVPAVAIFELWYGIGKSAQAEANIRRLRIFLAGNVEQIGFDAEDAQIAGKLRAELELAGRTIGAYDYLIAATALRHQLTLVTANTREFRRVRGLVWEDWTKA